MELNYLKTFDDYNKSYLINESLGDNGQKAINRAFLNMKEIPLSNGDVIRPKDIVRVVGDAINWIADEFRTYYSFARNCNIIYCVNDPTLRTMAVDQSMNMYMDVLFIYRDLKMDPELIAAIIMHEILHVIYNHIERGKNWLSANGRSLTKKDFRDTNLAGDVEVNTTLVNKHIIERDVLVKEIHGIYLDKKDGNRTNLPMEAILDDEVIMNKLRSMVEGPKDTRTHVDTSNEWDDGYKAGWDKVAELLDKYGAEETIKKLQEAGIIDANCRIVNDFDSDELLAMNFLTVKSFNQFIFESKQDDMYKTFDDGFRTGIEKAVSIIADSLKDDEDKDDEEQIQQDENPFNSNNKPVPNSKLQKDDLKKLNLPKKENKEDNKKSKNQFGDNLPTNTDDENGGGTPPPQSDEPDDMKSDDTSSDGQGENQSENGENGQPGNQGDSQDGQSGESQDGKETSSSSDSKSGDEPSNPGKDGSNKKSGSGDANQLSNDLKNKRKSNGGDAQYANKPKGKGTDDTSIGDTGSFMDDPDSSFAKNILKNSGYSQEDIDKIVSDVIEKNKTLNSPEGIQEKRKQLHSKLSPSDPVKKYLDEIEVSEAKFKNIWKKIMKQFLGKDCRRAGKDKRSKNFDWKNKRSLSIGRLAPNFHKEKQEPQDINIYVDVSGSVNTELLEVIAKSISIFCNQYEYSGVNIIPWASSSNGIHHVESIKNSSPEKAAKEILGYISQGISECGGGTDLIRAFLPEIVAISTNKDKPKKDDKHIIITDGETGGEETKIEELIGQKCGSIVPKNCFWMIYDAYDGIKTSWESSISKGTLLFINSQVVIGNK